jgi:hypothetical protein
MSKKQKPPPEPFDWQAYMDECEDANPDPVLIAEDQAEVDAAFEIWSLDYERQMAEEVPRLAQFAKDGVALA